MNLRKDHYRNSISRSKDNRALAESGCAGGARVSPDRPQLGSPWLCPGGAACSGALTPDDMLLAGLASRPVSGAAPAGRPRPEDLTGETLGRQCLATRQLRPPGLRKSPRRRTTRWWSLACTSAARLENGPRSRREGGSMARGRCRGRSTVYIAVCCSVWGYVVSPLECCASRPGSSGRRPTS